MKNLVIMPVGDNSLSHSWTTDYDFECHFLAYDKPKDWWKLKNVTYIGGEKWHMISKFIETFDFSQYDCVWFPDDDLEFELSNVTKLFDIFRSYNLKLAQPAVTGHTSFNIVRPESDILLRYVNWIEIMCPLMTCDTLQKIKSTFTINQSGWGLDFIWRDILERKSMAIIDHIVCNHTKPVSLDYGQRFTVRPIDELRSIQVERELSVSTLQRISFYRPQHSRWL